VPKRGRGRVKKREKKKGGAQKVCGPIFTFPIWPGAFETEEKRKEKRKGPSDMVM